MLRGRPTLNAIHGGSQLLYAQSKAILVAIANKRRTERSGGEERPAKKGKRASESASEGEESR